MEECAYCAGFYRALASWGVRGVTPACFSRHKKRPKSPNRFWQIGFDEDQDTKRSEQTAHPETATRQTRTSHEFPRDCSTSQEDHDRSKPPADHGRPGTLKG